MSELLQIYEEIFKNTTPEQIAGHLVNLANDIQAVKQIFEQAKQRVQG